MRAIPTTYKGVRFRSRLEATWAAFMDLIEWQWKYEPVDLDGWMPDFWVGIPCDHSECTGGRNKPPILHTLYAEVKPYYSLAEFDDHPLHKREAYEHPVSACFGIDPGVSMWEMAHGAGGGIDDVSIWYHDWEPKWNEAKNITQWRPRR